MKQKIKKGAVLIGIGFMLGLIYSNLFIYNEFTIKDDKPKVVAMVKTQEDPVEEVIVPVVEEQCTLDNTSCLIKKSAEANSVDWKLAVAISMHETGRYTSAAYNNLNNIGGMMYWDGEKMSLKSFNTLEDGVSAFIYNLKTNYIDLGLTTIEQVGSKYCPVGENDNGLNQYWIPKISEIYESL